MEIHYIELRKFKTEKDPENMEAIELWLNLIKKAGREDIKELTKRKEELKISIEMLKKISADELLREKYAAREKARLDAISSMAYVEARGEIRGRAEGEARGLSKGKAETLIRLISKKFGILPASLKDKILKASLSELDLLVRNKQRGQSLLLIYVKITKKSI